jgi:hypothetical protein
MADLSTKVEKKMTEQEEIEQEQIDEKREIRREERQERKREREILREKKREKESFDKAMSFFLIGMEVAGNRRRDIEDNRARHLHLLNNLILTVDGVETMVRGQAANVGASDETMNKIDEQFNELGNDIKDLIKWVVNSKSGHNEDYSQNDEEHSENEFEPIE